MNDEKEKLRPTLGFAIVGLDGIAMSICNSTQHQFQLDEYHQATVLVINNKKKPAAVRA